MKSIFNLLIAAAMTGGIGAETDAPLPKMVEVGKAVAESGPAELSRASADFEKALKEVPLTPSPGILAEVKAVQDASTRLLANLGEGNFPKDSGEAKAVAAAVKSTLAKLDSLIDENYKHQLGTANIRPPEGTPNASAGMNPDSISNPKLRQQYLDAIEKEKIKQQTNTQQQQLNTARRRILQRVAALSVWREAAGISKEEFVDQFSAIGKSRELLLEMVAPGAQR